MESIGSRARGVHPRLVVCGLILLLAGAAWAGGVDLGSQVLADDGFRALRGKRVGLITNRTGVNRQGRWTIDLLRSAPGVRLVALFAPEHGLRGEFAAGEEFPDGTDARTGLPVHSLYGPGPVRKPTPAMLRGLDALVYDVQDLGVRSYTYISTLGLAMEACGQAGIEFVVLDRPNPLGGRRVEGPMLDPRFRSFVGRWPVPYVYGLTAAELARMIQGEGWITNRCRLVLAPMRGWRRSMTWRDTGLAWVPTSPNVPKAETALHLVATGLLGEIGGVSIGMGAGLPFQCVAAPWLKGDKTASYLNGLRLPGVRFDPITYQPMRGNFRSQKVAGVKIRLTDPAEAPLVAINFHALEAVRKLAGRDLFAEAERRGQSFAMFDKVNGTDATRRALQSGQSATNIVRGWQAGEEDFRKRRERYLIYR
jgi:uncharacterized protein YbbC (DUF1343 family)